MELELGEVRPDEEVKHPVSPIGSVGREQAFVHVLRGDEMEVKRRENSREPAQPARHLFVWQGERE